MPVATTGIKYQSIHIHWIVISIQPVDVRRGVRVLTTGVDINMHSLLGVFLFFMSSLYRVANTFVTRIVRFGPGC